MRPLAVLFVLLLASPCSAQRLPGGATPEHYSLWFAPDFHTDTFRGRATIDVRLEKPSRTITLHAAEIEFGQVQVVADNGVMSQTATVTLNDKNETATLTVPKEMPAGPAKIGMSYKGILNDKLRGFYLSKANGREYAVSQMEATDARRAFPCFDEPAYKATFGIEMMIDEKDVAISNGKQIRDTPGPERGKHTVAFEKTKPMSTYLVALLVGDFVCREAESDGTPLRVCSTPDKKALTGFALEAAVQQLAFYNAYYGVKYPFGKLDIIGVPDFAAGAMENTGAITFREQYLLADPERASLETKKTIAAILSHEIAHMWFGDLVTMKWWDDIWLNEGFATWMANKPLAAWKPNWRVELDEVEETQQALGLDVLRSTRAIRTKVETPEEINEVFDAIAYQKSAGVIRMVESYVGAELFRKAVASYIGRVRVRERRGRGLLERGRARDREARRPHHEELRRPGRRACSRGLLGVRGRDNRSHDPAGTLRRDARRTAGDVAGLDDPPLLQGISRQPRVLPRGLEAEGNAERSGLCRGSVHQRRQRRVLFHRIPAGRRTRALAESARHAHAGGTARFHRR